MTPYQRVLHSGVLDEVTRPRLAARYQRLNPVQLRRQLDGALEKLWALADLRHPSVTVVMRQADGLR